MKLDDCQLLIHVHKAGTMRGAARSLHLSQPAISQRLKQMEDLWGGAIFIRTHKKLLLTPLGEKVLTFAQETLWRTERLREELEQMKGSVSGRLSLGISSVVSHYLIPPLLEKYTKAYPRVNIELISTTSDQIRRTFSSYHVAIFRGDRLPEQASHLLLADPLYLVFDKDIPIEKRPLIQWKSDPSLEALIQAWMRSVTSFTFRGHVSVDQIETCKQLMLRGVGAAILPEMAIKDVSDQCFHKLPLQLDNQPLERQTWVLYEEEALSLPQVEAFLQLLPLK
ncbi:LysR family transcriptional regulator [Halalkalibacterium halodurans]|uniref:Transcriptional regulator (LysR family) n=2 Tax=Halalkalibacterium halodurans TaxID=86665 RepID=Q9KBY7_HALH5|nr:LysR family transcriptional regulator [Halalkalibacterium halodurans]MDY7222347.1 LysR family transcriptional regulator [Halalkalibacterium halodurans]MDY7241568.1 LysR family transcriptional regulator [Halalkalibacterium halodurans]MED4082346.1 LysR family transcriptional regulator [Halalkalibacterium halodurans]MED4083503.1 LysR family transcriptional regulator [Halalkalibacterium halodurans]MED4105816.1 LysR family transcriptional regulator [Halalkalibacterium halodurans]